MAEKTQKCVHEAFWRSRLSENAASTANFEYATVNISPQLHDLQVSFLHTTH